MFAHSSKERVLKVVYLVNSINMEDISYLITYHISY